MSAHAAGGRSELAVIARLEELLNVRVPPGETYLGDDAAVLRAPSGQLLFATDMVVEGVHFDLALGSPVDAGWKALAVNVSDIAAMGGVATHAVVALGVPGGTDPDAVFEGLRLAASQYGVALVGGDLSASPQLSISVAIVGETAGLGPVLRSGASPGEELWATGPLGGSAAGLAALRAARGADEPPAGGLQRLYLRPSARPAEGRLAARLGATAMIDVSDGLASDVGQMAARSGVGVVIDHVPVREGASLDEALGGGEDYELVFALPAGRDPGARFRQAGLRSPSRIGSLLEDPAERRLGDGPLPEVGWVHELG